MIDFQHFVEQLTHDKIQEALDLAQKFNKSLVPFSSDKMKALNDCADSGEKIYHAMKALNTDYLKTLGLGLALLRAMQCQQEDENKQRGTWL